MTYQQDPLHWINEDRGVIEMKGMNQRCPEFYNSCLKSSFLFVSYPGHPGKGVL